MNGNPRPDINAMSIKEFLEILRTPRTCTKCKQSKLGEQFSITSERGKKVVRSRCKECMKEYYAAFAKRRVKIGAGPPPLARPDQVARRRARRLKLKAKFFVHPHGNKFAVLRQFGEGRMRSVGIFELETTAEAEALRLDAMFKE